MENQVSSNLVSDTGDTAKFFSLKSVAIKSTDLIIVNVYVSGVKFPLEVDTGARVIVTSYSVYLKNFTDVELKSCGTVCLDTTKVK